MRIVCGLILVSLLGCGVEPQLPEPAPKTSAVPPVHPLSPVVASTAVPAGKVFAWSDTPAFHVEDLPFSDTGLSAVLVKKFTLAKTKGLKPYVMVYLDDCKPCVALRKQMDAPLLKEAFRGVYLIRLNDKVWGEALESAGMKSGSFPRIHELADNGRATKRVITGAAWGEDVPANMAPPLQAFLRQ